MEKPILLKTSALLAMLSVCTLANAQAKPVEFQHGDWELACDNTRTCRAVGYQDDYAEESGMNNPVALMLKRNAGANQRVRAYVMFGGELYADAENNSCNTRLEQVTLSVNDIDYGKLTKTSKPDNQMAEAWELTTKQTHALINTLPTSSKIEFMTSCDNYVVSDKGSTAVLLKMDDVQGRVGTKGAIVKRGNKPESSVLSALATPVVQTIKMNDSKAQRASDKPLFAQLKQQMNTLAIPTLNTTDDAATSDFCDALTENDSTFNDRQGWRFYRLNDTKLLAEHACWRGAYNAGTGYWLMNDKPPYKVKLITDSGVDYSNGKIYSSHKGRGIGDCWSHAEWQWAKTRNGQDFVQTEEYTTGMCKGIAAGGAFVLPTVVTKVLEE